MFRARGPATQIAGPKARSVGGGCLRRRGAPGHPISTPESFVAMTRTLSRLSILAGVAGALCLGTTAGAQSVQPQMTASQRMIKVAAGAQIFETRAQTGPDGKVVRLDALMDVLAIRNNPMLDGAARERLKPAIRDWMGEVERVVIDNADFMEMLEPAGGGPGLIESLDSGNSDQMKMMNQVTTQLGSAGNLSARLKELGLISEDQHALNQHISADYFQACIREVAPPGEQAQNDQERL